VRADRPPGGAARAAGSCGRGLRRPVRDPAQRDRVSGWGRLTIRRLEPAGLAFRVRTGAGLADVTLLADGGVKVEAPLMRYTYGDRD